MKIYIAKEKYGRVSMFLNKPERYINPNWEADCYWKDPQHAQKNKMHVPKEWWKELGCENLRWEDEPIELKLERAYIPSDGEMFLNTHGYSIKQAEEGHYYLTRFNEQGYCDEVIWNDPRCWLAKNRDNAVLVACDIVKEIINDKKGKD